MVDRRKGLGPRTGGGGGQGGPGNLGQSQRRPGQGARGEHGEQQQQDGGSKETTSKKAAEKPSVTSAFEIRRGDMRLRLAHAGEQNERESMRFGTRMALALFLRPLLTDPYARKELRRALYHVLPVDQFDDQQLVEHLAHLTSLGRLTLSYLNPPRQMMASQPEQAPPPKAQPLPPTPPLQVEEARRPRLEQSTVDAARMSETLRRAAQQGAPFCEVCQQQAGAAAAPPPAPPPPIQRTDTRPQPKKAEPPPPPPKAPSPEPTKSPQEAAGFPPRDADAEKAAQEVIKALEEPPPPYSGKKNPVVGVMVMTDGTVQVALSGGAATVDKAKERLAKNLDGDKFKLAPTESGFGEDSPGFVRATDPNTGAPFTGDSHTCAESRLAAGAKASGGTAKSMAVMWRGNKANPHPDPQNAQAMQPCPSCAQNGKTMMSGVKTA